MEEGDDYLEFKGTTNNGMMLDMGSSNDVVIIDAIKYSSGILMGDGDDVLKITSTQFILDSALKIKGGSGLDSIIFDTAGGNYKVSDLIEGFESYDITGTGANTLTLNSAINFTLNGHTVRDEGGVERKVVFVTGNDDDTVKWYGNTTAVGKQTYNGVVYDVYTYDANTQQQLWVDASSGMSVTGL